MATIGNFGAILPNTTYSSVGEPQFIPTGGSGGGGGGGTATGLVTSVTGTGTSSFTNNILIGTTAGVPYDGVAPGGVTQQWEVYTHILTEGNYYSDIVAGRYFINGLRGGVPSTPPFTPTSTLPYLDFNTGTSVVTGNSTCILSVNSGNPALFQIDMNGTTNGQKAVFQTLQCAPVTNGGYALQINSSNCAAFGSNYALMSFSDTPSVLAANLFYTLGVLGSDGAPFLIKGNVERSNTAVSFQAINLLDASGADLKISTINGAIPGGSVPLSRAGFALVPEATSTLTVNAGGPTPATNGWWVVTTPLADPGSLTYWANSLNTTQFSINLSGGAPAGGLGFYWNAVAN